MVKIKSITDVITNSSSETFLIKASGHSRKKLLKELENIDDWASSGMGGLLEIFDSTTIDESWSEEPSYPSLPENFYVVDIDHAKRKVINYLLETFAVVDTSCCSFTTDKEGNITALEGDHTDGGNLLKYCEANKLVQELTAYLEKEGTEEFLKKYWWDSEDYFKESWDWDHEKYIKAVENWRDKFNKLKEKLDNVKDKKHK